MNQLRTLAIISSLGSVFIILGFILKVNTIIQIVLLIVGIMLAVLGVIGLIRFLLLAK